MCKECHSEIPEPPEDIEDELPLSGSDLLLLRFEEIPESLYTHPSHKTPRKISKPTIVTHTITTRHKYELRRNL